MMPPTILLACCNCAIGIASDRYRPGRQPGRGWSYPPVACFNAEVSAFDYRAPAELYASASKTGKRPMRYTRFKSAAEAIKYAVEVLPPELLIGSTLEVNEERFDGFGIRALYESANYPLRRRKTG
jgi:hypothetical protein